VTGAARGIGAAIAREADRRGANVVLADLRADGIEAVAGELRNGLAVEADVTDPAALDAAVSAGVERFGGIDVAVANAGIGPVGSFAELDPATFDRTIEINLLGVVRTLRAALPQVRERRGYLLGIASLAAPVHVPRLAHYAAAKAGVEALMNSIRIELEPDGVAAGCAYFGWIDTDMVREGLEDPEARAMREQGPGPAILRKNYPPEGAAKAVCDGIEKRARRVVYPRWIAPALPLRMGFQRIVESQVRRVASARDRG